MAYNMETIMAEKFETVIRRNIGTSRARDFYDLYMFYNLYRGSINFEILKIAVERTAQKRGSTKIISDWKEIIEDMRGDAALDNLWINYCKNNKYAAGISYENVVETTSQIAEILKLQIEKPGNPAG